MSCHPSSFYYINVVVTHILVLSFPVSKREQATTPLAQGVYNNGTQKQANRNTNRHLNHRETHIERYRIEIAFQLVRRRTRRNGRAICGITTVAQRQ